jgi:Coenzyme PQQ synthesis protein D (PqqD)
MEVIMKHPAVLPQRRESNLVVQELPGQTLVYDEYHHKAHYLNHTTALVWKYCDGQTRIREVANLLGLALGKPMSIKRIKSAVDQLMTFGLID